MELEKKTTILFSPDLHARLAALARARGVSLGHLVRSACEQQYGVQRPAQRREAARSLGALALPVGTVARMKRESVLDPTEDLGPLR